jgi:membrane-bound lytic murein transglycosylase A
MIKRITLFAIIPVIITAFMLVFLYYQGKFGSHIRYVKQDFGDLPAWQEDNHKEAFLAFKVSCQKILKKQPDALLLKSLPVSGKIQAWQKICLIAKNSQEINDQKAKAFFEKWFQPYLISNNFSSAVLFTGYYLPLIKGSFTPNSLYKVPIHGLPRDLLKLEIALFGREYRSQKSLIGRLEGKKIIPYYTRKEIMEGAINKTSKILLWSDSLVDLFFAQIQGSAIVELPNKKRLLIGYAGGNGRPYTPIGKVLISSKELPKKGASMQAIRQWLATHPNKVSELLNQDLSYVFFSILPTNAAIGAEGVPLTPERSLAVDTRYIPLGAPIWVKTSIHVPERQANKAFEHLVIAQDIGGAIKGMHGDIYWGPGDRSAYIAGELKNNGKWWILLPREASVSK